MIEETSATWMTVKKHIREKRELHVGAVLSPNVDERDADFSRGYLEALADLLNLAGTDIRSLPLDMFDV